MLKDIAAGGDGKTKADAHAVNESSSVRDGGAADASHAKLASTGDGGRAMVNYPASSSGNKSTHPSSSSSSGGSSSSFDSRNSAPGTGAGARVGGVGLGGGSSLGSRGLNLDAAPLLSPNAGQRPRTPRPGDSAPKVPNPRGNFNGLRGLMMVDIDEVGDQFLFFFLWSRFTI